MEILGFVKTSTVDYPGKIVAAIFLGVCNIDCEYCQNRELINPVGLESVINEEELLIFLKKRRGIIDGLCISGGEPTIHGDKLGQLMKNIKESLGQDFLIKLDTNGTNPEFLRKYIEYIDYVAIDYKTFDYQKNLNISKEIVLESIEVLKEKYSDYEVRLTLYPPYIAINNIKAITEELEGVKKVYLQNYRVVEGASTETYTDEQLLNMLEEFKNAGIDCEIR